MDDIILRARKDFARCKEHWHENFEKAKEDLRFARLEEQWPETGPGSKKARERAGRPCETFNKLPSFIRQVVNDARQNKPQIKVHPQDSGADPRTADIIQGLIRNIETTSDADVAYDTAIECAVDRGLGYWKYVIDYACDDTFEKDIKCVRVSNPLTVYGDPNSTAADSSDWNEAWIVTSLTKDEFKAEYPDAEMVDWEADFRECAEWLDGDDVVVAEWWSREKVKRAIFALADGSVVSEDELKELGEVETVGEPRVVESYKVTQRIISGAEVLKEVSWAGKYIPIVPVYGDEVTDETGKRHFQSLIRPAKGAQRMYNYMRNTGIEILALQPKAPFIGPKGAFDGDPNWDNVNDESVPYLEYEGSQRPERQPPPQGSQAALQEALNASDDMKAIIGIYDPALGARSNETSGVAINARQRESDVSTFHFIDNLQRAIRHGGRILLDLIPKVYSTARIARVLGEDMQPQNVQIAPTGQPVTEQPREDGSMVAVYDLTVGKYDLTVSAGPSFTTRREEIREAITEIIQANPATAPILTAELVKQMDFPNADELAEKLSVLDPTNQQAMQQQMSQAVGQVQQRAQEAIGQAQEQVQQLTQQLAQLQAALKDKSGDHALKAEELRIKGFEAETSRMAAAQRLMQPTHAPTY